MTVAGRRGAKDRFDQWLKDYPRATPIAVFCVALALVLTAAWSVELAEKRMRLVGERAAAGDIAAALERQAASHTAYLTATSTLFANLAQPSRDTFRGYVERLQLIDNLKGAVGLGWAQAVSAQDLPGLIREMTDAGFASFTLRPVAQPAYWPVYPVTMLEPQTPHNEGLIGFDFHSEPARAAAMDKARRTGSIAATGGIVLADGKEHRSQGFVVFSPVRSDMNDRRFLGFVFATVDTRTFVEAALNRHLPNRARVELFDGAPVDKAPVYSSGGLGPDLGSPIEERVDLFDRHWTMRYWAPVRGGLYPLSFVVFFGGAAFSLLLLAYVLLVQRRNNDLHNLLDAQLEQEKERAAFIRELNHRVKNALANVTSIISLTRHSTDDLDTYADTLLQRVRALAKTHALLDGGQWAPTDLHSLVEGQLRSHDRSGNSITIDGPDVMITPNDALTIGLALHELATNAMRYGALSTDSGTVTVRWNVVDESWVEVDWVEDGGPAVTQPDSYGFGLNLVQRALAHELRRPITLEFAPTGFRCRFFVQLRHPRSFQLRQ